MNKKRLITLLIISVALLLILNSAFIIASSGFSSNNEEKEASITLIKSNYEIDNEFDDGIQEMDEIEIPITGTELEKASAVALEYIGQGKVTDSEIGDEEGYYEIEITLRDGRQVDVHLDKNFKVLSTEWED
jgi:uncharacterized membrane protein YkoI